MFHILNATNGHKMAEATNFENANAKAQALADQHQQSYAIYQLSHCLTVEPIPQPKEASEKLTTFMSVVSDEMK